MDALSLMCRKCAARQGIGSLGGAMFVEDGVQCPFCDAGIPKEEFGGGIAGGIAGKEEDSGGPRKEEKVKTGC